MNDDQYSMQVEQRNEARETVLATLLGLRGMAEVEIANGSKVWSKSIDLIDDAITAVRIL